MTDDVLFDKKFRCFIENMKTKQQEEIRIMELLIFSVVAFIIVVFIGTFSYMYMFDLSWIDALYNASLLITAISIETDVITTGQKLFIIFYSLIAVILLLSIANTAIQTIFSFIRKH